MNNSNLVNNNGVGSDAVIETSEGKKPTSKRKKDNLRNYIRVGISYFKKITMPDKYGDKIPILKKWSKEIIKDDFGTKENPKPYLDIPKFDEFCNIPSNTSYRAVHGACYNLYHEITHQPKRGKIDKSLAFLEHIYGKDSTNYKIGLDYLTILYKNPKRMLPIHCLVSKERATGKTTFLKWIKAIFQNNASIMSNDNFKTGFNAHYAGKLVVAIDETFIDGEKKEQAERIKQMSTGGKIYMTMKGVDSQEMDFYGKLFMNSNNETNFVPIDKDENRYFITKVKPFDRANENPNLLEELISEIPAFLHFLSTRKMYYPEAKTRFWFDYDLFENEALQAVRKNTKPKYQKAIDDFIEECFEVFEVDELQLTTTNIHEEIKERIRFIDEYKIRAYLKNVLDLDYKNSSYKYFSLRTYYQQAETDPDGKYLNFAPKLRKGRFYTFKREDWESEQSKNSTNSKSAKNDNLVLPI